MRAKRRFDRFLVQREAKYFSQGGLGNWQECTISNVSRKGMKILFHERINVGSTICLDIPDPGFSIYGIVKWIEERGNDFIGGIELTKMLDDEKLSKLLTSSRLFHKKISTNIIKEATEDMKAHEKETIPPSPFIPNQHFILSSFKKVFSSKSISVSLLLLLSLLFLFLMGRGYFSRNLINEGNQKKDMVLQLKEVSSSIEPTETVSDQIITTADAHLATQNEPIVYRENGAHSAVLKEDTLPVITSTQYWGKERYAHSVTNIRADRTTESKIVGQLMPGQKIRTDFLEKNWFAIFSLEETVRDERKALGYVYASLLTPYPPALNKSSKTGAETKPGGIIMVVQCKKASFL